MDEFLTKLGRQIAELERACAPAGFAVAFSGGVDSTVLLAACRRLDPRMPLRALHVDHGLHGDSEGWARHCAETARALGVDFDSVRVAIEVQGARSLEAVARERRYAALGGLLRPREMLLTAHHEDDQLETVLLRLFRGAGVRGLRGILTSGAFAGGYIGRPLLAFCRAELLDVARSWGLDWLEDPANRDVRFDRSFLRLKVLPAIRRRWPAVARTVTRTARQMADAEVLLEESAAVDAAGLVEPSRAPLGPLRAVDGRRRRNLLRYLLTRCGLALPSAQQLEELMAAIEVTRADAKARVRWPGTEARIYGEHLYLMGELPEPTPPSARGCLRPDEPWIGPEGRVELVEAIQSTESTVLPETWVRDGLCVRFRAGGERLRPLGNKHHRALKKLLQEARIVPWMRSRIPLIYRREQLVAVGDLWVSDAASAEAGAQRRWRVRWSEHPALY